MSDDSDTSRNRRKRKTFPIGDSSDSDSSIETTRRKRRKHRICVRDSDSESDSSIEVVHKRRVRKQSSDSSESSSGSEILRTKRQVATLASDSDTSSSGSEYDSDWLTEPEKKQTETKPVVKNESSSESGDDQLDKCPICLLPFKNQEVGSPESCDHSFCIDCILEWSKNVNTCPVDRQVYNLILVRSNYNGKITKQIPIITPQSPNPLNEVLEDPTFCEMCGSCDREDRMLLCDGCDLGFHLECLDPPLEHVPAGVWFCPGCGPGDEESTIDIYEVHLLLEDAETLGWSNGPRSRNSSTRLVPRTRQSERVRARVITHRNQTQRGENASHRQEAASRQARNEAHAPGPSGGAAVANNENVHASNRPGGNRRRKKKRRSRIKITYEVDQATGERVAIETKIKHRRKRRTRKQRERARMVRQSMRSAKGRIALQLGMCPPRNNAAPVVETRASQHANNIGFQRSQAGIPALHLFGRRDDLDYYGGTDSDEDIASGNLLMRRRPQSSDVALFRRAARRKALVAPEPRNQQQQQQEQQSSTSFLDSILDIQSKFHSKNSVMSLNRDGSVKIDSKGAGFNDRNNNRKEDDKSSVKSDRGRINLNDYSNAYFRQTPLYGNGSPSSQSVYGNNADFTRRGEVDNRNAVSTSSEQIPHGSTSSDRDEDGQSYSLQRVCSSFEYDPEKKEKEKDKSRSNTPATPNSDSELDIYSDIETVSTSRAEEFDTKAASPAIALTPNTPTDEDANNSDVDLVIDTEKGDDSKEQVSSTVDLADTIPVPYPIGTSPQSNAETTQNTPLEIQNQTVQSTNSKIGSEKEDKEEEEDDDSEDGCPNFSIYSSESMNIAKTTDLQLLSEKKTAADGSSEQDVAPIDYAHEAAASRDVAGIGIPPSDVPETVGMRERSASDESAVVKEKYSYSKPGNMHCGLYSDSDDETLIKITKMPFGNEDKTEDPELSALSRTNESDKNTSATSESPTKTKESYALGDISNMTEDISEEERSYTPCLDERTQKQGLEGLDTEMISDEDRNDFDESHELKTASDGDALEINAKESELDFTGGKPEDYEEGEIVDKLKNKKPLAENKSQPQEKDAAEKPEEKEESNKETEPTPASFKKLSKNNKERNYREKDKENARSRSKEKKSEKENKKEKKKEKRKELERYNVRSMIAEKPRRVRDKFGRDESRRKSPSRSSRSATPTARRSFSRGRSASRERAKKRRARTKSRSRTPAEKRRSRSPRTRRQRSASRERIRGSKWRRSRERYNSKSRQSASPRRRREWVRRSSKGWSRSLSRSFTPEQGLTPSWTPPRLLESQAVKPQNLTVILNNDHNKKKKEKRKRDRRKELERTKKRKRNKTPPPSKEVFASGNNILVSVSFNKDKNQRDVINKRKRDLLDESLAKKRKAKDKRKNDNKRKKKKKDLSGVKPVAIIDLDRSPFREVTPSPEDVIVLTDSENAESNDMLGLQKAICDSSQQVASPERPMNANYLTGPKTPPEPQVKFTLNPKQTQIRAISNPLHEPDDIEGEIDPQEELEQRLNESLHKGPNTPPEPPNSPPSSPDAYDPFEPTKSRSPTPEPLPPVVQLSSTSQNDSVREESLIDSRNDDDETIDQSHTPPVTDIQPADSQCSNMKPLSPEKSPEQHIGVVINRVVQSQAAIFPSVTSKSIPSFSNASLVTSTPLVPPRINILNSTVLTPTTIASALPQRIVLPNTTKSSPVKVSPNKIPIKSTPIKPMPAKNLMSKSNKSARKSNNHNGNDNSDALLDFESPYSPGSSDYEDLFEPPPPTEVGGAKNTSSKPTAQKGQKDQSTFDVLFGSSPVNNCFKNTKSKSKGGNNNKYKKNSKGTKQVGVKIDEDTLKIMDELPNSAVEMQVKNKLVDDWVLSLDPSSTCSKDKLHYLKKLNRQERVVEEVKLVLKPHYNKKHVNKEEYKDILRRSVPKICHNKSGEINPQKIQNLIEAYVKKIRHSKKVTSSSSVNPQKA